MQEYELLKAYHQLPFAIFFPVARLLLFGLNFTIFLAPGAWVNSLLTPLPIGLLKRIGVTTIIAFIYIGVFVITKGINRQLGDMRRILDFDEYEKAALVRIAELERDKPPDEAKQ